MKYIILHRLTVPKEMLLDFLHSQLHGEIPLLRNRQKYVLQRGNVFLGNKHGKGFPVQNLKKRRHIIVGYDHRHTFIEDGLNYSRAVNFVAFWANAELAGFHVMDVCHFTINSFKRWAKDFHIGIPVFPVLK